MRITGLEIDRFGIWSSLRIDGLSDRITLFYGPNEAGKTTLMQFVRAVLYGFSGDGCRRFLEAQSRGTGLLSGGERLGGSLWLRARDGDFQVRRYSLEAEPHHPVGEIRVTSQDGTRQGAHRLNTLLGGIDHAIYSNVFAVGLREFQQLGTLNDTQAARWLYDLSTGKDRVSLVDVMRQLRVTQARLAGADGEPSLLGTVLKRRNRCRELLAELAAQTDRWARLVAERESSTREIARLESARAAATTRERLVAAAIRVRPKWDEFRRLDIELQALGEASEVPAATIERLGGLKHDIEAGQQRLEQLEQRRRDVRNRAGEAPLGDWNSRHAARARAFLEQRPAITALENRRARLATQIEETEFDIQAELERLGILADASEHGGSPPRIDSQLLARLHEPAEILEQDRQRWEQAQQRAAQLTEDAQQLGANIAAALGHEPAWIDKQSDRDVVKAVENTGDLAARLRKRIAISRKLVSLRRERQALDHRHAQMLRSQLLPWEVVKALGGLFALGATLVLCGLFGGSFGWSDTARGTCVVLGGIAVGVAALVKVALDSTTRDEIRIARQRTDRVRADQKSTRQELDQIDSTLPGHEQGQVKLDDAESRLTRLEALLPLETRRRHAQRLAEQAHQQASEIASDVKFQQRRWEEALSRAGLNPQLTPAQFRNLAGESAGLTRLYYQQEQLHTERETADRELRLFRDRLRDGLLDMQVRTAQETPLAQLDELQQTLRQHQEQVKHRDALLDQDRQLRRDEQATARQLRQTQRQVQTLLSKARASDEEDLLLMKQRAETTRDLAERRKLLRQEIEAAVQPDADVKDVLHLLRTVTAEQTQQQLNLVRQDAQRTQSRWDELLRRQGELAAQLESMESDRELALRQLEMGELHCQLDRAAGDWQLITAFSKLLTSVYKSYEKERQPETLRMASRYLERMTSGRYLRIWTPLAENVLIVDDAEGRSQSVEALSRGTREQVFLSLRLALISHYARRGMRMPVVLDDVLVNFDAARTVAAAEVLVEFARAGHQVLVFTCHQHMMQIFQALAVEIRELPGRQADEVVAAAPTVTSAAQRPRSRHKRPATRRPATLQLGFADQRQSRRRQSRHLRAAPTAQRHDPAHKRSPAIAPLLPTSRETVSTHWPPEDGPLEDDLAHNGQSDAGLHANTDHQTEIGLNDLAVDASAAADRDKVGASEPRHEREEDADEAESPPPPTLRADDSNRGDQQQQECDASVDTELNPSTVSGDEEEEEQYEYVYEYVDEDTDDDSSDNASPGAEGVGDQLPIDVVDGEPPEDGQRDEHDELTTGADELEEDPGDDDCQAETMSADVDVEEGEEAVDDAEDTADDDEEEYEWVEVEEWEEDAA